MPQDRPDTPRVLHVFNNVLSNESHKAKKPSRQWLYWQMTLAVTRKVIRAPFSLHTWGALRRTLLSNFIPDTILFRYKAYQRGECNRCGLCCKIQFDCPFLIDDGAFNTSCSIYTTPHAPQACLKFPLDPMDLRLLQREVGNACTFYYEGAPQKLTILEFAKLYAQGIKQHIGKRKLKEASETGD
jgi:hypothetical protein